MNKWKCIICEYIVKSDEPPKKCPVCGASTENFKKIKQEG